jgi:hypothetical protein
MTARRALCVPILLALAAGPAHAQAADTEADTPDALRQLLASALSIHVTATILPPGALEDTPVWNAESTNLTLPGRSIKIRLDGDNVRIYLVCTPYMQEDGEVLLLAQGQVWFMEPTDKDNRYFSTFYSIPVSFGEPILFFPLGFSDAAEGQKDYFNIKLEIRISPYEQK